MFALLLVVSFAISFSSIRANDVWVVIMTTSRYWYNYRHTFNGNLLRNVLERRCLPESRLVVMTAQEIFKDNRHPMSLREDIFNGNKKIAFVDEEASLDSFRSILTGRQTSSSILDLGTNSAVLVFMAGHGGDEFFKFHDNEELTASHIGEIIEEMQLKGRFKFIVFVIDTCQAATLSNYIFPPNVVLVSSSMKGENSYGDKMDSRLGLAAVDRFTNAMQQSLQKATNAKLSNWIKYFPPAQVYSTPTMWISPGTLHIDNLMLSDVFQNCDYFET